MRKRLSKWMCGSMLAALVAATSATRAGNPVIEGWYADPDAAVLNDVYWIFPTSSVNAKQQIHFDAFSSRDLKEWTRHPSVVDNKIVTWADNCMWAPGVAEKDGKYYFFFSARGKNFPNSIGVCVADKPEGPYKDLLGKPLLRERHNGAQPIDQSIFKDKDGSYYMVYGGEGRCNIVKLNDDFTGFVPLPDGETFKEITPTKEYAEGPVMFIRDGKYYLMWSEGLWFAANYRVSYGIADSPFGPFKKIATVLKGDPAIATGPGHHSVINKPGTDEWYIVYHRRPPGDKDGNHRVTCIDPLVFDAKGHIEPVKMTNEGVQ